MPRFLSRGISMLSFLNAFVLIKILQHFIPALAKRMRRDSLALLELVDKVAGVLNSHLKGNLVDRIVCGSQELLCAVEPRKD